MAKNKLYSETMRELSLLDEKSLQLYQMKIVMIRPLALMMKKMVRITLILQHQQASW